MAGVDGTPGLEWSQEKCAGMAKSAIRGPRVSNGCRVQACRFRPIQLRPEEVALLQKRAVVRCDVKVA